MRPVRLAPPTWPCSAKRPGRQARVIATGDTAQLGAVEAGGMFRLLAQEVPAARLHEVRRFTAEWERRASVRLRDGDLAAAAACDRHGRICGSDEEAACDRAVSLWLADHLRGKDVLLLAGSNAEAADLSRRVQAKLAQMGRARPPQAALSDGTTPASATWSAWLNTEIDVGGRQLTNRDTLVITAFRGPDAEARRQRTDGTWTGTFRVPRTYLARNAELASQVRQVDHPAFTSIGTMPGPLCAPTIEAMRVGAARPAMVPTACGGRWARR
jgi:AAA domain